MNKKKAFSITKGYSFTFREEEHQIEAWFSALSGLEKIYVNGELVSSQRNLSTNSTNTFKIGENKYSTNLQVISLFKGPFICTLSKNGGIYKSQRLIFPKSERKKNKMHFLLILLFCIGLGVAFGMAKAFWQLSNESEYISVIVLFVVAFLYFLKTNKGSGPLIEEENIV